MPAGRSGSTPVPTRSSARASSPTRRSGSTSSARWRSCARCRPISLAPRPSGIFSTVTGGNGGVHAMLCVGFDDVNRCWIIKNSWGAGWGNGGFVRVAYGEGWLEGTQWWGVRNTNPDPWTKRRQRNGVVIESGNGAAHQNREVFLRRGLDIFHDWQEAGAGPWNSAGPVALDRRVAWVRLRMPWTARPRSRARSTATTSSSTARARAAAARLLRPGFEDVVRRDAPRAAEPAGDSRVRPGQPRRSRRLRGRRDDEDRRRRALDQAQRLTVDESAGHLVQASHADESGTASGPALVSSRRNLTSELEQETGELHYVCASGRDSSTSSARRLGARGASTPPSARGPTPGRR